MYSMYMLATEVIFSITVVLEMQHCMAYFARYSNYTNDRCGKRNIVLQICYSTFLSNIINIGQNLTKLLHKNGGAIFH